jgi:hypothetical protein
VGQHEFRGPLLKLPMMYLIYPFNHTFVTRVPQEAIQAKVALVDAQPG